MAGFSPATKFAALSGFLIPGAGHVILGRIGRGVWLFFWFAFFVNAWLVSPVFGVWGWRLVPWGTVAAAGVIWLFAALDLLRILIWRNRKALENLKREKFLSAFGLYLKGDYPKARLKLRGVLKLDRDDPDAHFHIGMTYKREGNDGKARHYLRHSVRIDPDRKWEEEVKRELSE